ncbi:hypothetical protein F5B20DRAFT_545432 [Whalleya microplaca]|nr:hypothetical protein F5B20DRAFT_545432 [Whalleya microplaca]
MYRLQKQSCGWLSSLSLSLSRSLTQLTSDAYNEDEADACSFQVDKNNYGHLIKEDIIPNARRSFAAICRCIVPTAIDMDGVEGPSYHVPRCPQSSTYDTLSLINHYVLSRVLWSIYETEISHVLSVSSRSWEAFLTL